MGAGGSGVDQASLEPQASIPLMAPKPPAEDEVVKDEMLLVCAAGGAGLATEERLKAELVVLANLEASIGGGDLASEIGFEGAGAGADATGWGDMENRSLMPLPLVADMDGLADLVGGDAADEKSPKSAPKDSFLEVFVAGAVGVGFMSKKLPPLRAKGFDWCVWPVGEVKPENGAAGLLAAGCEEKERDPNASPRLLRA